MRTILGRMQLTDIRKAYAASVEFCGDLKPEV
jgi:hypothetical protein